MRNPGFMPCFFHDPGQYRRGGSLPVGAGHDQIMTAAQKIIFQDFRQREIKKLAVQDGFDLGITALDGIADDYHVGIAGNVFSAIAGMQFNTTLFQKSGHRRINVFIRSGDIKATFPQGRRDRAHGRSADPEKMEMFRSRDHANFYAAFTILSSPRQSAWMSHV